MSKDRRFGQMPASLSVISSTNHSCLIYLCGLWGFRNGDPVRQISRFLSHQRFEVDTITKRLESEFRQLSLPMNSCMKLSTPLLRGSSILPMVPWSTGPFRSPSSRDVPLLDNWTERRRCKSTSFSALSGTVELLCNATLQYADSMSVAFLNGLGTLGRRERSARRKRLCYGRIWGS